MIKNLFTRFFLYETRTKLVGFQRFLFTQLYFFCSFFIFIGHVVENPKKPVKLLVLRNNLRKTYSTLWKTFVESVDNLWKANFEH